MAESLIVIMYFFTPALLIYLTKKIEILNRIGVIVLSYAFGFILALTGILPENIGGLQDILTTIIIPIAIPLLLFSTDLKSFKKLANDYTKSLFIAIFATMISIASGYYLFMEGNGDGPKIAGLLTGLYTGGTPNLASIKAALNVDANTYILVHTTDLVIGTFYLMFFITIAQKLLNFILIKDVKQNEDLEKSINYKEQIDLVEDFSKENRKSSLAALGTSVLVFGFGGGLSLIVPEQYSTAAAILSITTFSILLSFYKPINQIKQSFSIGMYLILVFSIIIASMANFENVINESAEVFYYVIWAMFGTFILQIILSKIFKVSTDITIITATAMSMSPPFVPVVASALKNKSLILPGIIIGVIGYIIGNYLGVFIGLSL